MLKAKFDRVADPETGGAAFYPDTTSDWFDHSVGMPTVVLLVRPHMSVGVKHTVRDK